MVDERVSKWAYGASTLLAAAVVAAPVVLARLAGDPVDDWIKVYVAGAVGGVVMELIGSRGQLELPGPARRASRADARTDARRPLLPEVDLGAFARMFTGGLAAFVVVVIVAASTGKASALADAAAAPLSLGWAVAVGSASAAAWQWIAKVVQARLDAAADALATAHTQVKKAQDLTTPGNAQGAVAGAAIPSEERAARASGVLDATMATLEVAAAKLGRTLN